MYYTVFLSKRLLHLGRAFGAQHTLVTSAGSDYTRLQTRKIDDCLALTTHVLLTHVAMQHAGIFTSTPRAWLSCFKAVVLRYQ